MTRIIIVQYANTRPKALVRGSFVAIQEGLFDLIVIPLGYGPPAAIEFIAVCIIFPRLVNTEASKDFLITRPHTQVEDLSMVYAVRINENSTGFAEAVIDDDLAKMCGVGIEDLHKAAMSNVVAQTPVFVSLEKAAMFSNIGSNNEDTFNLDAMETDSPLPLYMLTNRQKTKGAVMAMCGKVMMPLRPSLEKYTYSPPPWMRC